MRKIRPHPIPNTKVVGRVPELLRLCANKKFLHLGCADFPFTITRGEDLLHRQLGKVTKPELLWGLDASDEGVRLLREMGFQHIIHANAELLSGQLHDEKFDIILAGRSWSYWES